MDTEEHATRYCALLVKLMSVITSEPMVTRYVLTKVEEVLTDEVSEYPKRAAALARSTNLLLESTDGPGVSLDSAPFMRHVYSGDSYTSLAAAMCLALLLSAPTVTCDAAEFVHFVLTNIEVDILGSGDAPHAGASGVEHPALALAKVLAVLLRRRENRATVGRSGGVDLLSRCLQQCARTGDADPQLLYELCLCLWTLSFEEALQPDFVSSGAVGALTAQVQSAPREKVQRVAIACFANLSRESPPHLVKEYHREMIHCGLMKVLSSLKDLKAGQWKDADIAADIDFVLERLGHDYQDLSTWDKYAAEVGSGALCWGVCHEEQFWKENVRCMEADNFQVLQRLTALLSSADEEVVAIACSDIGEFCRFYPRGRDLAKHFGAKDVIMKLIDSANDDVQRHALSAISKIMIDNWSEVPIASR